MKNIKKLLSLVLVAVCVFALTACNKVTEKNYNKIEVNMSQSKVVSILGDYNDSTELGDYFIYYWFDGAESVREANEKVANGKKVKAIVITMSDSVVISKDYIDWEIK